MKEILDCRMNVAGSCVAANSMTTKPRSGGIMFNPAWSIAECGEYIIQCHRSRRAAMLCEFYILNFSG